MNDYSSANSPAEEHREVAAAFTTTVTGVAEEQWELPAPPEGWVARDVVAHLIEWFPAFLRGSTGLELPEGPDVQVDPVGAWQAQTAAVQALLDDPTTAETEYDFGPLGTMSLADVISMVYIGDVFLHRWDLARATGQDETLDPEGCARMLAGMEPMDEVMRRSGHYGPRVAVAADADVQTRLLAFIGRTP